MDKVTRISVSLPSKLVEQFDELTAQKTYLSRSKAIGDAIRSYIAEYNWDKEKGSGIGIITVLYDHKIRGAAEKIIEVQHGFHHEISSNTHIHLDEENCLEVLIVKANAKKINELASKLQALKGIKQTKMITIGI